MREGDATCSAQELDFEWHQKSSILVTSSSIVSEDDPLRVFCRALSAPQHQLLAPSCPLEEAIASAQFTGSSLYMLG